MEKDTSVSLSAFEVKIATLLDEAMTFLQEEIHCGRADAEAYWFYRKIIGVCFETLESFVRHAKTE